MSLIRAVGTETHLEQRLFNRFDFSAHGFAFPPFGVFLFSTASFGQTCVKRGRGSELVRERERGREVYSSGDKTVEEEKKLAQTS